MDKLAMLAFPNFGLIFDLYTDASEYQIEDSLIQTKKTNFLIWCNIRKFTSTWRKYTVTETNNYYL